MHHAMHSLSFASQGRAGSADHELVACIWKDIEQLLSTGHGVAVASIRQLANTLPSLDSVPNRELPSLAQLHLSSASNLMATIKLLVPHAFNQDSAEPDMAVICSLTGTAESMVSTLIELQLLHLTRAKEVTQQMRLRIAQRQPYAQLQEVEPRHMQSLVTSSTSSGACCDEMLVQSLE